MADKIPHLSRWQLPEWEISADQAEMTTRPLHGYNVLRNMQRELRAELTKIAEDPRLPHEGRKELTYRAASAFGEKLDKWKADFLHPARDGAELLRSAWLAGAGVVERVSASTQREIRDWLRSMPAADRQRALTTALAEKDHGVIVAALTGPKAFGLIVDDRREHFAREVDPAGAAEIEALEEAAQLLRVGSEVLEGELKASGDADRLRADAIRRANAAEAQRRGVEPPPTEPTGIELKNPGAFKLAAENGMLNAHGRLDVEANRLADGIAPSADSESAA